MLGQGVDSFLGALGQALKAILAAIRSYRREQEQQQAQTDRQASDADPGAWLADHFSDGVRDLPKSSSSADQTDPASDNHE